MTEGQWNAFVRYRDELKSCCESWLTLSRELQPLQQEAAAKDTPPYPLETAVVYNQAYDAIERQDTISLIVIGDNPGKEEQLAKNRRYLVGQSGRVAEGFFRRHPELGIDFRKNVIIMNKTPVHTAKTSHLRHLMKHGSERISSLLLQSQQKMAQMAAQLHQELVAFAEPTRHRPQLWLVGYAELKNKGLFLPYRDTLYHAYMENPKQRAAWNDVYVYQHFSMNRFLIDLKDFQEAHAIPKTAEALAQLGHQHRDAIFSAIV